MKENKLKSFFAKFSKSKKEIDNKNTIKEEDNDNGESIYLEKNDKQKMDYIENKDSTLSNDILNDLSLSELSFLERELSFKYDIDDYKVIKVNRENNTLKVECEIIDVQGNKKNVIETIRYKEIKDSFQI